MVSNINRFGRRHHRRRRLHIRPLQRQQHRPVAHQLPGSHLRCHSRTFNRHYLSQEPSLGETRKIHLGNQCLHFCTLDRVCHDLQYCQPQSLHLVRATDVPRDVQRQLQLWPDHSLEQYLFIVIFSRISLPNSTLYTFFTHKFWPIFGNQNKFPILYV